MVQTESQEMEVDEQIETITLKVLPIVKERQQQHGLRHSDFQRYHGYCSRRLRRLRETLKMPQGDRRHFKKKEITALELDTVKGDPKYLEIPLTMTERAWAYAMMLKQESNTDARKKFHLIARMKKAVAHSTKLTELVHESNRVDARTKLECDAYAAFIQACFYFELKVWEEAMTYYKKAQAIYIQVGQALGPEHPEAEIYNEKSAEILPSLRFCAYQTGEEFEISELAAEFQSTAIHAMIAQKPKMAEIDFRKHKIPIPTERIATVIVRIEEFDKKPDKKVEMYEEILIDLRDAIQHIRETSKQEVLQQGTKAKPNMALSYLLYLRLKVTNSRTECMMKEKQAKDCVRLSEMVIHNYNEMKTIPSFEEDEDFQSEINDYILAFKGIRCRYLGDVLKNTKKWGEGKAIYAQAENYFNRLAKGTLKNPELEKKVKEAWDLAKAGYLECRVQHILAEDNADMESAVKLVKTNDLLIDRLDKYVLDESLLTTNPNVANFPPEFRPIPPKPLFFDLALNHIKMPPEIEESAGIKKSPTKEGAAGISGFVKGLWGWGSKK